MQCDNYPHLYLKNVDIYVDNTKKMFSSNMYNVEKVIHRKNPSEFDEGNMEYT